MRRGLTIASTGARETFAEREWAICKGLRLVALTELPDTL
jgi:hypothetical protein